MSKIPTVEESERQYRRSMVGWWILTIILAVLLMLQAIIVIAGVTA